MDISYFTSYGSLGLEHITDLNGYDHILFVAALTVIYSWRQWRNLLWLVTAFTVGHSLTLALATLKIVPLNSDWVEFLIPVTILITSVLHLSSSAENDTSSARFVIFRYGLALVFGLIHGLGFSNFLQALLGREESLLIPLLAFNVGLEVGQLVIVSILLVVGTTLTYLKIPQKWWQTAVLLLTAFFAILLIKEKWFF